MKDHPLTPLLTFALLLLIMGGVVLAASAMPSRADPLPPGPAAGDDDGETFVADDSYPIFDPALEPPPRADIGPAAVIGDDERVPITDTTIYPWSAIAWLGLYDVSQTLIGSCTGTFVGPDAVLTAAHCLYDAESGWTQDIAVAPGRDGDYLPYEYQWAESWWVPDKWIDTGGDPLYDWGVIKMPDTAMGSTVGWFSVANLGTDTLSRSDFTPAIVGYPGDKPEATMWGGWKDAFLAVDAYTLSYDIDTAPGQSGSAVFSANVDRWFLGHVVGVHVRGGTYANEGMRIEAELLDDILTGCREMGCSIDHFTEVTTPTPTPAGDVLIWGDVDCSGFVKPSDSMKLLQHDVGLSPTAPPGCPRIGDPVRISPP